MIMYDYLKLGKEYDSLTYEMKKYYKDEIKRFCNNLENSINNISRGYNNFKMDTLLNDMETTITRDSRYLEIMNKIANLISESKNAKNKEDFLNNEIQNTKFYLKRSPLSDYKNDLMTTLRRHIKNEMILEDALYELNVLFKRLCTNFEEIDENLFKELSKMINNAKTYEEENNNKQAEYGGFSAINIIDRCKDAINKLPALKAIEYIENEFSMLDNNEQLSIIRDLEWETVPSEIEEYLSKKEAEIKEAKNRMENLNNLFM